MVVGGVLIVLGFAGILGFALIPGTSLWFFFLGLPLISAGAGMITGAPGAFYRDLYRGGGNNPVYIRYRESRRTYRDWFR
jgi:hypothetical protein